MMTFTYILLWLLIGIYACGIIYNHKLENSYKNKAEQADIRQKSADELYNAAMDVMTEKHKLIAYNKILDAAEERHRIALTGEVLTSDLDKEFHVQIEEILDNTQEELNK